MAFARYFVAETVNLYYCLERSKGNDIIIFNMKEIHDIEAAYQTAVANGQMAALATVVKVEGSSYRQPGARMLVTEDGQITGAISGGCLEGDALKKALLCISQKQNKLITYDTSNEDDIEFGVQLGCNGIVHILFEFIDDTDPDNPLALLSKLHVKREDAVVVVLFSTNRNLKQHGTCLFFRSKSDQLNRCKLSDTILIQADDTLAKKQSIIKNVTHEGLQYDALFEYIVPPTLLIIAGAGNDVVPLVKAASLLGWEVIVADGRYSHAKSARFPDAKSVIVAKPESLLSQINIDKNTYFALLTHNYNYDLELLNLLLETEAPYIGVLGPKSKLHRMLSDIEQSGTTIDESQSGRIYGPIGLDIGAETSEEIAMSIIAEIQAVKANKKGLSLKFKSEKIHNPTLLG